ncbi:hypothetical protein Pelo_17816 [Pelomyxa schiedti]|nr:hypothetical protein Pelo_17816 [Pelomyxa schiedti]
MQRARNCAEAPRKATILATRGKARDVVASVVGEEGAAGSAENDDTVVVVVVLAYWYQTGHQAEFLTLTLTILASHLYVQA